MYELVTFQTINVCNAICYGALQLAIAFKTVKRCTVGYRRTLSKRLLIVTFNSSVFIGITYVP
jgi:hypothetical protein